MSTPDAHNERIPVATILGLDLGKRRDWTALAIVQKFSEPGAARHESVYDVPFLDRVQNESYELIADRMAALKGRPEHRDSIVAIDETGVGTAVGDMLVSRKLRPHRITITGGSQATTDGLIHHVPKRDLATVVAIVLESRRLRIAEGLPLAKVLRAELENFQVKISLTGHDSYGAGDDWREGNHDDLVLAVALAVWLGEKMTTKKAVAATPMRQISAWGSRQEVWN